MLARELMCDVGPALAGKAVFLTTDFSLPVVASSRLKPVPRHLANIQNRTAPT
jgi:hypothetical protein